MENIEEISNLCHEQWSHWTDYLFSKCKSNKDGTLTIPKWAVERWKRQINTQYVDLSETEKESDRIEARKFIEIIK